MRIINESSFESFDVTENEAEIIFEAYPDEALLFSVQGIYVEPKTYESIKDRLGV